MWLKFKEKNNFSRPRINIIQSDQYPNGTVNTVSVSYYYGYIFIYAFIIAENNNTCLK